MSLPACPPTYLPAYLPARLDLPACLDLPARLYLPAYLPPCLHLPACLSSSHLPPSQLVAKHAEAMNATLASKANVDAVSTALAAKVRSVQATPL
jgi:hypothetical protein